MKPVAVGTNNKRKQFHEEVLPRRTLRVKIASLKLCRSTQGGPRRRRSTSIALITFLTEAGATAVCADAARGSSTDRLERVRYP